jgi:hypothetical protein
MFSTRKTNHNLAPVAATYSTNESSFDGWTDTPEQRTGVALLGEQNLGGAATSRVMDSMKQFMGRDTWGSGGRVVRGVEKAQAVIGATDSFMDSGAGKLAKKLPGVGRYARTIEKGAELGKAVSDGIDSFGGINGIVQGVEGAIRDPRAALDMAKQGGGRAAVDSLRVAAGNLAEQVGLGEMTPEGRLKAKFNVGRMATVGAELFATGGASGLAMLTEAGAAGLTQGIHSAQEYAHAMPAQFASIPKQEQSDPWTSSWNAQPAAATAGWGGAPSAAPTYDDTGGW